MDPAHPIANHFAMQVLVVLVIAILLGLVRMKVSMDQPTKLQQSFELLIDGIQGMLDDIVGHGGKQFIPMLFTLALFIFLCNISGVIPSLYTPTEEIAATLGLALFQSLSIALALEQSAGLVLSPGFMFRLTTVSSLVAGTMFLMWLGEQITERGLGNGISILIFGGIAAGLPGAIGGLFELVRTGAMGYGSALVVISLVVLVTFAVVFVERGQRKILVNYAKRQVGNKVYGGQSSHLPLKLNMSGVIPPIFASSIILLPTTIVSWIATGDSMRWLKDLASMVSPGQPIYVLLYSAAIVFFCFFYTALVFNSRETADNLKKSGAFIPGIRPGEQTAKHIDKILSRLTLAGAIYITLVCLLPEFLTLKYNVPFYFGGTSLLIIVVVTMDFWAQVQSYIMSQQYESLLKKASFKPN